jgi:polyisoprenyl-teichoic acid--peptidoglycan teichoic acid transferase
VNPVREEVVARSRGRARPAWARRFFGGGLLIAVLTTAVISTAVFEGVSSIADALAKGHLISSAYLSPVTPGQPQTILVIGSDKRYQSTIAADRASPPHTDTIILIRLDPGAGRVTVMSVPRDLLVPSFSFKGVTYRDEKINFAYSVGNTYGTNATDGDNLTLEVVRQALDNLPINDIIDLNFESFVEVVAKLGCVYVDVDHYFYNPGDNGYSAIDVKPGYQCLSGDTALDYVRFRHSDSTFARDARQQDFLRQAKQQLSVTGLLTHWQDIVNSLGGAVSTNIRGATNVLRMVELVLESLGGPVRTVEFPDDPINVGGADDQTATPQQISHVIAEFLNSNKALSVLPPAPAPPQAAAQQRSSHAGAGAATAAVTGLSPTPQASISQAQALAPQVPFAVELPQLTYDWTQQYVGGLDYYAYRLKDLNGNEHWAYHIAWQDTSPTSQVGAWYGIEGTDWTDPPLFANADKRTYAGRQYLAVGDGRHVQDLGWIDNGTLYWINNTLFDDLSNAQMYALAASARAVS